MIILGVNISHNSSACLMIHGDVKLAIQEERLIRKKNFTGYPKKSIDFCIEYLKKNKIKADYAVLTTKFLSGFSYKIPLTHFFTIKDYQDFYVKKFYIKIFQNKSVDKYVKTLVKNRNKKYDNCIDYDKISHRNIFKNCNHLFIDYLKYQTKNYVKDYKV